MLSKNNNNNNDKLEKYARLKRDTVSIYSYLRHTYSPMRSLSSPYLVTVRLLWLWLYTLVEYYYPSDVGVITTPLVLDVFILLHREFLPMIIRESHWVANWSKNWRKCTNNKRNCIILLGLARQQMVSQKTNVTLKFNWIVRPSDTIEIKGIMSFEFEL